MKTRYPTKPLEDQDITIEFATQVVGDTVYGTGPDPSELRDLFLRNVEKCLRRDPRFQNLKAIEMELLLADARRDTEYDLDEQLDQWREYIVKAFEFEAEMRWKEDLEAEAASEALERWRKKREAAP